MNNALYRYYVIDRTHRDLRVACEENLGEQYKSLGLPCEERMTRRPDMDSCNQNELADRQKVILDTYHYPCAQGDSNVWFIDGSSIFRGPYEELCTVDGVHPNDMGFAMMADAIGSVLKRAFSKYWDNL